MFFIYMKLFTIFFYTRYYILSIILKRIITTTLNIFIQKRSYIFTQRWLIICNVFNSKQEKKCHPNTIFDKKKKTLKIKMHKIILIKYISNDSQFVIWIKRRLLIGKIADILNNKILQSETIEFIKVTHIKKERFIKNQKLEKTAKKEKKMST